MTNLFVRILGIRSDFEYIFFNNEYVALAGHRQKTIGYLLLILFLTFLALGFAVGSLENLRSKMDNPYTNWVDFSLTNNATVDKAGKIMERYNAPEVIAPLQLNNCNGYSYYEVNFHHSLYNPLVHSKDTLLYRFWGRTIRDDEPLFMKIIEFGAENGNLLWHAEDFNPAEPDFGACGIIATAQMLQKLGYEKPSDAKGLVLRLSDMPEPVFIDLVAVVKELPGQSSFISSSRLYNILASKEVEGEICNNLVIRNQDLSTVFRFITYEEKLGVLDSVVTAYFEGMNPETEQEAKVSSGNSEYQVCRISFDYSQAPSLGAVDTFIQHARRFLPLVAYTFIECADQCNEMNSTSTQQLAFHFNRLDKIRDFRKDIFEEFGIEIEMSQVEAKENFALVSRLTFSISMILLFFGVLSIVMYVNNLLRTHLFEMRSNLGTFQAFGLNNRFLLASYLKIILSFLLLAIGTAFLLAIGVDRIEQLFMGDESRFSIFSVWVLVAILCIMVPSLLLAAKTIRLILGDTPGNLIYER